MLSPIHMSCQKAGAWRVLPEMATLKRLRCVMKSSLSPAAPRCARG